MSRSHTEKDKKYQEKYQAVLSRLLREEDNKYCVDCEAKGPRWASWNLGIFLCIRCAGIHRNLGVHISRVKSVNLDSWTEEQIQSMENIGNTKARIYYEANLPANYRRPQTDSPLESFIRAKYEHKKYADKNKQSPKSAIKPKKEENKENKESGEREKRRAKKQEKNNVSIPRPAENSAPVKKTPSPPVQTLAAQAASLKNVHSAPQLCSSPQNLAPQAPAAAHSSNQMDLLGLDSPAKPVGNGDLLGLNTPERPASSQISPVHNANPPTNNNVIEDSLFGSEENGTSTAASKTSKESILALYGSASQNQTRYGVPGGMYIPSQQSQPNGFPATSASGMPQQNAGIPQQMAGMPQSAGLAQQSGGLPQQVGGMHHMGMPQQAQQPQPNMAFPQANSFSGMGRGAAPQQGMMGNPGGMMGMYNPNQAHLQQQQQQQSAYLQQVQAKMQNMRVGGGGMPQQQQPQPQPQQPQPQQPQQQPQGMPGGWGMPSNPPPQQPAAMQGGFGPSGGFGAPAPVGAAAGGGGAGGMGWGAGGMSSSGQTLSTQLWK